MKAQASSWPREDESPATKSLLNALSSTLSIEACSGLQLLHVVVPSTAAKLYRSSSSDFFLPSSSDSFAHSSVSPSASPSVTASILGPIADSVNKKNSSLTSLLKQPQHNSQLQKAAARKWLDRSLARGRRFNLSPTSSPQDPMTSMWTLVKRLPPGPSRLSLNSPSHARTASSDMDLPQWAAGLIRINQSPQASFDGDEFYPHPSHSETPVSPESESERARGGVSALRALMMEAEGQ